MTGVFIFLTLLVGIIFWLTQTAVVNIVKDDGFRIEFHFIFFALILDSGKREKRRVKERNGKLSLRFYKHLFSRLSRIAPLCEIEIKKITVPSGTSEFNRTIFTKPYRYHTAISAAVAYLGAKAQKLTLNENAITLTAEENSRICLDISLRVMLFHLLFEASKFILGFSKYRKKRKGYSDVGN